ncbi:hypothetical protein LCGC14_2404910, partial [marine sediment metagenome]
GRVAYRRISYYIDEVKVASFTPGDGALGGTNPGAMVVAPAVNAQNGNVCAVHSEMLGESGWELIVQEGAPVA